MILTFVYPAFFRLIAALLELLPVLHIRIIVSSSLALKFEFPLTKLATWMFTAPDIEPASNSDELLRSKT